MWLFSPVLALAPILSLATADAGPVPSAACQPKAVAKVERAFEKATNQGNLARAGKLLSQLLDRCEAELLPEKRHSLRNDLALVRHDQGDQAGCLAVLASLEPKAANRDGQVKQEGPASAGTTDEQKGSVKTTSFLLRLCSQPLLENEPRRLIGQRFHGIQEIEPSLRETSGGMLVTERGRYASGTYHKPSWQPTLRSREKALYLVVELGENAGETRVEKVLDVLFVDLDRYPPGAMQSGDWGDSLCQRPGQERRDVLGVFPTKGVKQGVKPYEAWRIDVDRLKFVPVAPGDVICDFAPENDD
jgi:hypothetical protein